MKESIMFNVTTIDHVHISWAEVRFTSYEELRFICRDVYGLLELFINDHEDCGYNRNNIRIILINHITCDKDYERNMNKVVKTFCDYYSDSIIISQVCPTKASIDCNDIVDRYIDSDNIEEISDYKRYSITNYGKVIDRIDGSEVPQAMFEDGPKVGLMCKDNHIKFFPISYLMEKVFKPSISEDWDVEFDRLCKLFESFGFASINNYCQFEYSDAYVYLNELGKIIVTKANDLTNKR